MHKRRISATGAHLLLVTLLTACVASPWAQRDAANSFTRDWERVGFTNERQVEILQAFNCSNIRVANTKTFREKTKGDNCTVLGEKIPEISVSKFPVGVSFDGGYDKATRWCDYDTPAIEQQKAVYSPKDDMGRQVMERLNARLPELSQMVFQGKAGARLEWGSRGPSGKRVCSFDLKPIYKD